MVARVGVMMMMTTMQMMEMYWRWTILLIKAGECFRVVSQWLNCSNTADKHTQTMNRWLLTFIGKVFVCWAKKQPLFAEHTGFAGPQISRTLGTLQLKTEGQMHRVWTLSGHSVHCRQQTNKSETESKAMQSQQWRETRCARQAPSAEWSPTGGGGAHRARQWTQTGEKEREESKLWRSVICREYCFYYYRRMRSPMLSLQLVVNLPVPAQSNESSPRRVLLPMMVK